MIWFSTLRKTNLGCRAAATRGFVAMLMLCAMASYSAADIIHSDVNGGSVWFTNISEGSPTGDPLPLYGQPFSIADQLIFTPTGAFSATSQGGSAPDQTDGKLTFIIEAKPGSFVSGFKVNESGVTNLTAPFGGNAFTSLLAFADVKVLQVNGVDVNAPTTQHFMTFNPANNFLFSDLATGPTYASAWQGSLSVNLPDLVTKVLVTIDNILTASTMGVGTTALIDKKSFSISVEPVIPEPGTIMLGMMAMAGMFVRRSR